MKKFSELEEEYKHAQAERREKYKGHFWKMCRFYATFPFVWVFYNIRDFRTLIIFLIVFVVVSCEVWVPYLLGAIIPSIRTTMWAVGSACWLFWAMPGTPFLVICIGITATIKVILNKWGKGKKK